MATHLMTMMSHGLAIVCLTPVPHYACTAIYAPPFLLRTSLEVVHIDYPNSSQSSGRSPNLLLPTLSLCWLYLSFTHPNVRFHPSQNSWLISINFQEPKISQFTGGTRHDFAYTNIRLCNPRNVHYGQESVAYRLWRESITVSALDTHDSINSPRFQHVDCYLRDNPSPLRSFHWRCIEGIQHLLMNAKM